MILDRLTHADLYAGLSPGIAAALKFLRTTDLARLQPGRHEIDGENLYAMCARYTPRPLDKIVWESHRRYLDVQYVVSGQERMGYVCLSDQLKVTKPYDAKTDAALYETRGDLVTVPAGFFTVYWPQDVHAPGLAPAEGAAGEVHKVVVKVRV